MSSQEEKINEILFNKEFKGCEEVLEDHSNRIKANILSITSKAQVRNQQFYIDTVLMWLADYDDGAYLGCYENKIGDVVVALYHNNTIYLLGECYRTIMYAPKLMFHNVSHEHIHIDDVLMKNNSVGNGSVAMIALLLYAQKKKITKITGTLSSVDDDHKVRRDNYYRKFGFTVAESYIIKTM